MVFNKLVNAVDDVQRACRVQALPAIYDEIHRAGFAEVIVGVLSAEVFGVLVQLHAGREEPDFALGFWNFHHCVFSPKNNFSESQPQRGFLV